MSSGEYVSRLIDSKARCFGIRIFFFSLLYFVKDYYNRKTCHHKRVAFDKSTCYDKGYLFSFLFLREATQEKQWLQEIQIGCTPAASSILCNPRSLYTGIQNDE